MHDIDSLPVYIQLGRLNEKGVNAVQFDVTAWLDLYPTGLLNITYTRPTETTVYPVDDTGVSLAAPAHGNLALTVVDGVDILTWTVSDAVTYIAGTGTVVIGLTVGADKDLRSNKALTIVDEGHAAASTPPEPLADYIAKWGAVDVDLTEKALGEPLTQSVTQDGTGTHFDLEVHTGTGAQGPQGIQGIQGVAGQAGAAGVDGDDGASAFAQAVMGGYNDTEANFLLDLAAIEGLAAGLAAL